MADAKKPDLMTMAQVCAEYQISEETVRRWIREQRIPFVMIGPFRMKRIDRAALETVVPAKPVVDPFDPQGQVTTPTIASAAAPVAPKPTTVTRIHKREASLSCGHKITYGNKVPLPDVGAAVTCTLCPKP